jgi:hypothetical protein
MEKYGRELWRNKTRNVDFAVTVMGLSPSHFLFKSFLHNIGTETAMAMNIAVPTLTDSYLLEKSS